MRAPIVHIMHRYPAEVGDNCKHNIRVGATSQEAYADVGQHHRMVRTTPRRRRHAIVSQWFLKFARMRASRAAAATRCLPDVPPLGCAPLYRNGSLAIH